MVPRLESHLLLAILLMQGMGISITCILFFAMLTSISVSMRKSCDFKCSFFHVSFFISLMPVIGSEVLNLFR